MNLEELCEALCSGLAMQPVPIGYAIKTPFVGPDGDAIAMYMRRQEGAPSIVRFEDDGGTIAGLAEDGVSLEMESRSDALTHLLYQYGAHYDESGAVLHTDYFEEGRAPANFAKFMALLLRVQDLRMLTRERVARAFRDDVRDFIKSSFEDRVDVTEESNPNEVLKDYVADFVLRTPGHVVAVYAVSTELKALEALILWQELQRQKIQNIRSMAILETPKPQLIKQRTMSRLMNSGVILGSMQGTKSDLVSKIEGELGMLH